MEKTCAIKEGLSQESAILVGSGTVGKQHTWWQHSPAAPQCREQTVHVVPAPQPGLCGNDENITGALGHCSHLQLLCKSSQTGAQQLASEPGPLTQRDAIVEITVPHKVTGKEFRTALELINTGRWLHPLGAPTTPNSPTGHSFGWKPEHLQGNWERQLRTFLGPESTVLWFSHVKWEGQ